MVRRLNWLHKINPLETPQFCAGAFGRRNPIIGTIRLVYHIGSRRNEEPFHEYREFAVMNNSSHDVILGMPFLVEHNPQFDYKQRTMRIRRNTEQGTRETLLFPAVKQSTHSPDVELVDIQLLRCQLRSAKVRAKTELYWVYVRPKQELEDANGPENDQSLPAEVNVAAASVVSGDAGRDPQSGAPTDHTPSKETPGKSEGEPPLSDRLAATLAKYDVVFTEPRGVIPRPGFEHARKRPLPAEKPCGQSVGWHVRWMDQVAGGVPGGGMPGGTPPGGATAEGNYINMSAMPAIAIS